MNFEASPFEGILTVNKCKSRQSNHHRIIQNNPQDLNFNNHSTKQTNYGNLLKSQNKQPPQYSSHISKEGLERKSSLPYIWKGSNENDERAVKNEVQKSGNYVRENLKYYLPHSPDKEQENSFSKNRKLLGKGYEFLYLGIDDNNSKIQSHGIIQMEKFYSMLNSPSSPRQRQTNLLSEYSVEKSINVSSHAENISSGNGCLSTLPNDNILPLNARLTKLKLILDKKKQNKENNKLKHFPKEIQNNLVLEKSSPDLKSYSRVKSIEPHLEKLPILQFPNVAVNHNNSAQYIETKKHKRRNIKKDNKSIKENQNLNKKFSIQDYIVIKEKSSKYNIIKKPYAYDIYKYRNLPAYNEEKTVVKISSRNLQNTKQISGKNNLIIRNETEESQNILSSVSSRQRNEKNTRMSATNFGFYSPVKNYFANFKNHPQSQEDSTVIKLPQTKPKFNVPLQTQYGDLFFKYSSKYNCGSSRGESSLVSKRKDLLNHQIRSSTNLEKENKLILRKKTPFIVTKNKSEKVTLQEFIGKNLTQKFKIHEDSFDYDECNPLSSINRISPRNRQLYEDLVTISKW